ncbi:lipoprotein [Thermosipho affectus]|uniref:FAD:protein FMN transferase n=1 Tax=Thermosipho affectus TaxID=660294 RepID=A0ABX3IGB5_9BACT|nr:MULTISPECIES: FAD:protein FMN transferase [Thermosipho]ANQ54002.1 ApbE family lipoprotein [Thermosipho sp. 1070]APT72447.1 lipoprotein [Thermosipho sp. 1063]ONN26870.1 lipoprotein [Thermosipho affectus]OOC42626.1 lipoprotein [Thermosipho sp. 1074]
MRKKNSKDLNRLSRISLIFTILLVVLIGVVLITSFFKKNVKYETFETFSLGTYVQLRISTKSNATIIAREIFQELNRITKKFDPYNPESIIYKLNNSNGWLEVDDETFAVVDLSLQYAKITNGSFDPTLGRLVKLWGFDKFAEKENKTFKVPARVEIDKVLKKCGYEKVEMDYKNRRIKTNGVWLDLGGIVKGYALERAYQIAKEADQECTGFIEAGGDIRILGPKFGRDYWIIGIRNPRGSDSIDYIYLKSGAVATSGDYERFFVVNGKRYHHILDISTGYPATSAISATVIADDAIKADAFSTAAFVLGKNKWLYTRTIMPKNNADVFLVTDELKYLKTDGFVYYENTY